MSLKTDQNSSSPGDFKLIWKDLKFVAHPGIIFSNLYLSHIKIRLLSLLRLLKFICILQVLKMKKLSSIMLVEL